MWNNNFFFQKYFSILVIKYLTPVHLIISVPVFYFFQKISLVIYNFFKDELYNHSAIQNIITKFIIDIFSDCFSFFEFLVYLEIIELKCGKISYNIKRNITRRSFGESYGIHENQNKINIINNNEIEGEEEEDEEEEEDDSDDFTLN